MLLDDTKPTDQSRAAIARIFESGRGLWNGLNHRFEGVGEGSIAKMQFDRLGRKSEASLSNRIFGRLEVSHFRVPTLLKGSDRGEHPNREEDVLCLSILLRGNGCLKQGRRTLIQGKHEIVLYQAHRRFLYDFAPEAILVKVPRDLLASRHAGVEDLATPIKFASDRSLNLLLANLTKAAMSVELSRDSAIVVGTRLASSILEIASAIIDSEIESSRAPRGRTKPEAAQSYALANLRNQELSPERIAKHIGVSRRTLNRLFAQVGVTPMRWVWQRRLEACHSALIEGAHASIADLSAQFCFKEVAHFSRTFKGAYGLSPAKAAKFPAKAAKARAQA